MTKGVKYAKRTYTPEVRCLPGSNQRPADILVYDGPNDLPLAIDVTVCSSLTKVYVQRSNDLSECAKSVAEAERIKIEKYREGFSSMDKRIRFLPCGITTFGSMGPGARKILDFLADVVHKERFIPKHSARNYLFRLLVGDFMAFQARLLSQGIAMASN